MTNVLVLNIDYTPLEVIPWQDAMEKIVTGKVELIAGYANRFVHSAYQEWVFPAVVRLTTKFAKRWGRLSRRISLSRINVLARDAFTCQYCGVHPRKKNGAPDENELTIDHVVPRAQSRDGNVTLPWSNQIVRVSSWENLVAACYRCNSGKAAKSLAQAKMTLAKYPRAPTAGDVARMAITRHSIPEEWKLYLPDTSPWRDYWTVALDAD